MARLATNGRDIRRATLLRTKMPNFVFGANDPENLSAARCLRVIKGRKKFS
jgi:hypothetical protein